MPQSLPAVGPSRTAILANGASGTSDMAGNAARVAVERSGSGARYKAGSTSSIPPGAETASNQKRAERRRQ